jgi:prepilin-type N-terminal cleavage/methylation domain-containing protein
MNLINKQLFNKKENIMFKRPNKSEKGFTLIELMIVIAIIGILAAIAIPNFISYRNKAFCSAAESDANSVASDIADYFAIPSHTDVVTADVTYQASGTNTFSIVAGDPSVAITITVTDGSSRCPVEYQEPSTDWGGINNSPGIYTKVLAL